MFFIFLLFSLFFRIKINFKNINQNRSIFKCTIFDMLFHNILVLFDMFTNFKHKLFLIIATEISVFRVFFV